jgi:hypothetical protein
MFRSRSVRHPDSRIRAEREYALSTKERPAKLGDREVRMHKLGSLDAEFVFRGLLGRYVADLVANITPGSPLLQPSLHPPLHPTDCEKSQSCPYIPKNGSPSADRTKKGDLSHRDASIFIVSQHQPKRGTASLRRAAANASTTILQNTFHQTQLLQGCYQRKGRQASRVTFPLERASAPADLCAGLGHLLRH